MLPNWLPVWKARWQRAIAMLARPECSQVVVVALARYGIQTEDKHGLGDQGTILMLANSLRKTAGDSDPLDGMGWLWLSIHRDGNLRTEWQGL
jgi:hypothetical protein